MLFPALVCALLLAGPGAARAGSSPAHTRLLPQSLRADSGSPRVHTRAVHAPRGTILADGLTTHVSPYVG